MSIKPLPLHEWRPFNDECPHCGDDAEVFTTTGQDNLAYDGDKARCVTCNCPGGVVLDDAPDYEGSAYIAWHDEPNCDCEWCKTHPV